MTAQFHAVPACGRLCASTLACALLWLTAAAIAPAAAQAPAPAQLQGAPSSNLLAPVPSTGYRAPAPTLLAPGSILTAPPPSTLTAPGQQPAYSAPVPPPGQVALMLGARFAGNAPQIAGNLVWRVYSSKADEKGAYKLVKEERGPSPVINLPAGSYVVHVAFGLATAARTVQLNGEVVRDMFDLPAGGVRFEGKVGDIRIPAGQISFDIYPGSQFDVGDRRAMAERVLTGDTVIVPEGTYFVVSNYGDGNSTVRSDIRVQAGKLTDVTVNHRAAMVTLKLVTARGGEALASTAWSVLTPGGDVIKESIGAFPRVVLQEGDYRAIARNEGKVFEREFKVVAGVDGDVEILAR